MKNVMKKMMLVIVMVCVVSGLCSANLLTNGGFENPVVPAGGTGSPVIPGWTISSQVYSHLYDAASLAHFTPSVAEGNQALYLLGGSATSEGFAVVAAGQTYTVTFSAALNQGGHTAIYSSVSLVDLDLGNAALVTINLGSVITGDVANKWFNGSVTYDGATWGHVVGHRIAVQANSGTALFLDNFSATAVPEPATMALLGLGGLIFARKRSV